jgi:hypothetical protein
MFAPQQETVRALRKAAKSEGKAVQLVARAQEIEH